MSPLCGMMWSRWQARAYPSPFSTQTVVRKRAAVFDFWGHTPTPEFRENSHERGPRSPAGTAQGFDPPLGPHRSAAGTARTVCAGVKRAAAHWLRCASAGAGQGGKAGAAARCRGAAGGGAGKTAAPSAACVGFQATSAIEAAGERKSPFLPYKEALFSGRGSCQIRAVLRPNPCRFGRVAFSAAQSDECVTPGGAGEKPRRKTKRPSERSSPHEKPDFRYRD